MNLKEKRLNKIEKFMGLDEASKLSIIIFRTLLAGKSTLVKLSVGEHSWDRQWDESREAFEKRVRQEVEKVIYKPCIVFTGDVIDQEIWEEQCKKKSF